jgi:hypothetical protein
MVPLNPTSNFAAVVTPLDGTQFSTAPQITERKGANCEKRIMQEYIIVDEPNLVLLDHLRRFVQSHIPHLIDQTKPLVSGNSHTVDLPGGGFRAEASESPRVDFIQKVIGRRL